MSSNREARSGPGSDTPAGYRYRRGAVSAVDEQPEDAEPVPPVVAVVVDPRPRRLVRGRARGPRRRRTTRCSRCWSSTPARPRTRPTGSPRCCPTPTCTGSAPTPASGPPPTRSSRIVHGAAFHLLCHDDVALQPGAVRELVLEEAFRSNAGIVGPKLVTWDEPRPAAPGRACPIDKTGHEIPLAERGELDQEQHDAIARRVLHPRRRHPRARRPLRGPRRLRPRHHLPGRGPRPLLARPPRRRPGAGGPVGRRPPPGGARRARPRPPPSAAAWRSGTATALSSPTTRAATAGGWCPRSRCCRCSRSSTPPSPGAAGWRPTSSRPGAGPVRPTQVSPPPGRASRRCGPCPTPSCAGSRRVGSPAWPSSSGASWAAAATTGSTCSPARPARSPARCAAARCGPRSSRGWPSSSSSSFGSRHHLSAPVPLLIDLPQLPGAAGPLLAEWLSGWRAGGPRLSARPSPPPTGCWASGPRSSSARRSCSGACCRVVAAARRSGGCGPARRPGGLGAGAVDRRGHLRRHPAALRRHGERPLGWVGGLGRDAVDACGPSPGPPGRRRSAASGPGSRCGAPASRWASAPPWWRRWSRSRRSCRSGWRCSSPPVASSPARPGGPAGSAASATGPSAWRWSRSASPWSCTCRGCSSWSGPTARGPRSAASSRVPRPLSMAEIARFNTGPIGSGILGFVFLVSGLLPLLIGQGWRLGWAVRAWVLVAGGWLLAVVAGTGVASRSRSAPWSCSSHRPRAAWRWPPRWAWWPSSRTSAATGSGGARSRRWRRSSPWHSAPCPWSSRPPPATGTRRAATSARSSASSTPSSRRPGRSARSGSAIPRCCRSSGWELTDGVSWGLTDRGYPNATDRWSGSPRGGTGAVQDGRRIGPPTRDGPAGRPARARRRPLHRLRRGRPPARRPHPAHAHRPRRRHGGAARPRRARGRRQRARLPQHGVGAVARRPRRRRPPGVGGRPGGRGGGRRLRGPGRRRRPGLAVGVVVGGLVAVGRRRRGHPGRAVLGRGPGARLRRRQRVRGRRRG